MSYVEMEMEVKVDDLEDEEDGGKREKERRGRWR